MSYLRINNFIVEKPLIDIINELRLKYPSNKLKSVEDKGSEIVLTCVNRDHSNGEEHNPDAHINLDSSRAPYGWYHCFACGLSCSFVDFIAHYFEISFEEAQKWLINKYGILAEEAVPLDDNIRINIKAKSNYLDESVLDNFQTWTPYFAKRRISREMCENFKLRYDPKFRQAIFPVYDIKGRLKMLAKRSIDSKIFYLDKDQEKEVYGLNIIQKNNIKQAIITEGPFDCLSSWCQGIPAIATFGAISDYQIEQLNKSSLNILYLGFDNDSAGKKFASIIKNRINNRIITIEIQLPKDKKDLNELSDKDWAKIKSKYFSNNNF